MLDATSFACPDVATFCRLDGLGLVVTGQRLEPERAVRWGSSANTAVLAGGKRTLIDDPARFDGWR